MRALTKELLLEGGFFSLEGGNLLLETGVLGLLMREVALHLLLDPHQLVRQRLLHILCFHREDAFQGLLLRFKN